MKRRITGLITAAVLAIAAVNPVFAQSADETPLPKEVLQESLPEVTPEVMSEMTPEMIPPQEHQTLFEEVVRLASDGMYGELSYRVNEDGTVTITDCDTDAVNVSVPEMIDGIAVTGIGDSAFYGCGSLTSITLPESVTSIGEYAFNGCSSLKSIALPNSLLRVDEYAFEDCNALERVYISDLSAYLTIDFANSYSAPMQYADELYLNNEQVTDVIVPDEVTKIPVCAFEGCDSLTSISLPESVTSIGGHAFKDCSSLTNVMLHEGITNIGNGVFCYCSSLESISLPSSLTSIGQFAFGWCDALERVYISDLEAYLNIKFDPFGSYPVAYAGALYLNGEPVTDVVVPDGVTKIPTCAFMGCDSLTSISLPNSVTSIGGSAFYDCNSLTNIILPDSVTSIGYNAFNGCGSLSTVYYTGTQGQWNNIDIDSSNYALEEAVIYFMADVSIPTPMPDSELDGSVVLLTNYDPVSNDMKFNYSVVSFGIAENINNIDDLDYSEMVGKYVLAEIDDFTVTSICAIENGLGVVTNKDDNHIEIDGVNYTTMPTSLYSPNVGDKVHYFYRDSDLYEVRNVTQNTGTIYEYDTEFHLVKIGGSEYIISPISNVGMFLSSKIVTLLSKIFLKNSAFIPRSA